MPLSLSVLLTHCVSLALVFCKVPALGAPPWREVSPSEVGIPTDAVTCLRSDRLGRVWMGTHDGGIAASYGGQWRIYREPDGDGEVHCIAVGANGDLWAGIDRTLWRFADDRWHQYQREGSEVVTETACGTNLFLRLFEGVPSFSHDIVDLQVDDEDYLWILRGRDLSNRYSIVRFRGRELVCFENTEALSVFYDGPSHIEVVTRGRAWITGTASLPWSEVVDFMPWIDMGYLSATAMARLADGEWGRLPTPFPLGSVSVAHDGALWATGWNGTAGVYTYEGGSWTRRLEINDPSEHTREIAADDLGGLWVVLGNSYSANPQILHLGSQGEETRCSYPHDMGYNRFFGVRLLVDDVGRLWLGDGKGLFVLDGVATRVQPFSWGRVKTDGR